MTILTTNTTSTNKDINEWKSKIISITLYMKGGRSFHDLTIYHRVLSKKYWMDKDTIDKLYNICDTINLHVVLSNNTHVLPVYDINKVTTLDEDAFMQYLYDRTHNK